MFAGAALVAEPQASDVLPEPAGKRGLVEVVLRAANEIDAQVGFAAYDMKSGQRWTLHADQRFPMASIFKTLACAALLQRVDGGGPQPAGD